MKKIVVSMFSVSGQVVQWVLLGVVDVVVDGVVKVMVGFFDG